MIPTHIIQVAGIGVADAFDICASSDDILGVTKFPLWNVESKSDRALAIGLASRSQEDAIAMWNSAFSKAPIQYTDKGKVCD